MVTIHISHLLLFRLFDYITAKKGLGRLLVRKQKWGNRCVDLWVSPEARRFQEAAAMAREPVILWKTVGYAERNGKMTFMLFLAH
jgi:hypothetical protein